MSSSSDEKDTEGSSPQSMGNYNYFLHNTSVISLSKNYVFHKRIKHINAKYHFIKELINNDEIVLQHYKSQE